AHRPRAAARGGREVRRRPGRALDAGGRARRGAGHDRGRLRAVPAPARLPAAHASRPDRDEARSTARRRPCRRRRAVLTVLLGRLLGVLGEHRLPALAVALPCLRGLVAEPLPAAVLEVDAGLVALRRERDLDLGLRLVLVAARVPGEYEAVRRLVGDHVGPLQLPALL